MKNLFERLGEILNPKYSTSINDRMNSEEITGEDEDGIELLEELANSHCEECGCDLENNRYSEDDKYCKDCSGRFNREDTAFERQRGN